MQQLHPGGVEPYPKYRRYRRSIRPGKGISRYLPVRQQAGGTRDQEAREELRLERRQDAPPRGSNKDAGPAWLKLALEYHTH